MYRIEQQNNVYDVLGNKRIEYAVINAEGQTVAAFETDVDAQTAIDILTGGPGALSFYDYQAQCWYPKEQTT